jgi:DnaK suppressor protein
MPRATRSTPKQPSRGQARTAATGRKKVTKTTAKTPARATKTSTTARRTTTSKTARTATPPAKSAARSRATTKTAKVPAKTPAKAVTVTKAATKAATKPAPKAPAKPAPKPAAKAPAKRALRPEDKKFLAEQKTLLLEERQTYTQQAASLKAEADQLAEEMEPGDIQFDEESGEGGTMNVERERDLALSAQALTAVEEIDKALLKIADGSYGYCEQCGQPIPKARLKALPYASLCVACKSGGLSRR